MKSLTDRVTCYISSFAHPLAEQELEKEGIARGMVLFAIPDYGVLFKCRAQGNALDLELGALLALLRFLDSNLKDQKIKKVMIFSSLPDLVFSLAHRRGELTPKLGRQKKLDRYFQKIDVRAGYVPPGRNRALSSPVDLPQTPRGQKPPITPGRSKIRIEAILKGVDL